MSTDFNKEKFDDENLDASWAPQKEERRSFGEQILPWAQSLPEGPLLDLAGGQGFESQSLADAGFDVTLVDRSAALLHSSQYSVDHEAGTRSKAIRAEMQNLPFPDGHFSGVLLKDVWIFLSPQARIEALNEMKRVLKDGGSILLISQLGNYGRIRFMPSNMSYPVKESCNTQEEMDKMLAGLVKSGDKIVSVEYFSNVPDTTKYAQQVGLAPSVVQEYDREDPLAKENRWIAEAGYIMKLEKPASTE